MGFSLAGIAPATPSDHGNHFREWIAQGQHGHMQYLAENIPVRLDPEKLLGGAQSIICVADRYPASMTANRPARPQPQQHHVVDSHTGETPLQADAPRGRIARYAWADDYHRTIKKRLFELVDALGSRFPEHQFRVAVDTAPVMEREHAARAGLGWTGKHTLLIHPDHGSWMLLGVIVTTLHLQSSQEAGYPGPLAAPTDHCGNCTRCIDACPTSCITPYSIDARRCISYLTLEHRGPIDPTLHRAMGNWIAGCDVCQEVCPFNQPIEKAGVTGSRPAGLATPGDTIDPENHPPQIPSSESHTPPDPPPPFHPAYTPRPPAPDLELQQVIGWKAPDRQEAFFRSALKRIKLDMIRRNAVIAVGNHLARHDNLDLRQRIRKLAEDPLEPSLVQLTAQQVLASLGSETAGDPVEPESGE